MKILPRFLYLFSFIGMATAAALALDRALVPSMSTILLRAVIVAALCSAAGLVHRRAWGVSLLLLPVGCYLLLRTIMPAPSWVEGVRGVYHFYMNALATGGAQYTAKFFPLNLAGAPELRLLLAFTVFWLVGSAAFLALSLRRPVPGIALVLLLLGFGFTVDAVPKTVGIALLFFLLAACMLVFARSLERRTWRLRDAIPGVAVGAAGSLLAILLLGAAPSAAASPWQDWRAWNPFKYGSTPYSFNWLENYPQLLNPADYMVIMRVHSTEPSYWRANALDSFDGDAWISSQSFPTDIPSRHGAAGYVYSVPTGQTTTKGEAVTEEFEIRSIFTNYLFAGGEPRSLTLPQRVSLQTNDIRALHVSNALGPSLDYTTSVLVSKIKPDSLVGLGSDYPESVQAYLELPFSRLDQIEGPDRGTTWRQTVPDSTPDGWQWAGLYALNQEIVGDASDPYDITLRIEKYLRNSYAYNLDPPASKYPSPYAAFLFDTREGYCQHFSGVMAMLLRFNGIPARVAVGFATGDVVSPGVYQVATTNAHAWVEAYFPTVGWLSFDPTPGRSIPTPGASSTSPDFKDPFATDKPGQSTATTAPLTTDLPDKQNSAGPTSESTGAGTFGRLPWLPWILGVVVLVAAWPLGRRLWRERGLHRGTPSQRLAASLQLLRAELGGYEVLAATSLTLEDVLDVIENRLGVRPDPLLAARAGAILFGGRLAREQDFQKAEQFRREVKLRLRKRYGWMRAVLWWYGVRRRGPARGPAPEDSSLPGLA